MGQMQCFKLIENIKGSTNKSMNKIICAFYNCIFSFFLSFFYRECPDTDSVVSRLISNTNAYANIVKHYISD